MPKVHNIGQKYFLQFMRLPAKWDGKIVVRGYTQEVTKPFRQAEPLIVRLPFYRAVILGKWNGQQPDEESAINNALRGRILTDEDFDKKKGWSPAPATSKAGEEGVWDWDV